MRLTTSLSDDAIVGSYIVWQGKPLHKEGLPARLGRLPDHDLFIMMLYKRGSPMKLITCMTSGAWNLHHNIIIISKPASLFDCQILVCLCNPLVLRYKIAMSVKTNDHRSTEMLFFIVWAIKLSSSLVHYHGQNIEISSVDGCDGPE